MNGTLRLLPEESRQDAVLLSWPVRGMDWTDYLSEIHATYEAIVRALLRFVDVVLITPPDSEFRESFLQEMRQSPHTLYRISGIDLNDTWIRDYGPLCLVGDSGQKMVVDYAFNGWGGKFEADRDNAFTRRFHEAGFFSENVVYRDCRDFVFEGGAIDVSGSGCGLTTASVLEYPGRNDLSRASQVLRLMRDLGLRDFYVLTIDPLPGDDTDGHVDTMVRFLSDSEIVTCVPLDPDEEALLTKKYTIRHLPMPNPILWDGEVKPATYANFLITNGAILVPTYGDPVHDKEALEIIRSLSDQREVVGIDCRVLVRQNGSLHCATMQIPEGFLDKSKLTKA